MGRRLARVNAMERSGHLLAGLWRFGPTVQSVPAEFLSDQEAAAFGRYGGSVPLADLERFFCLDDADRKLVAGSGKITTGSGSASSSPQCAEPCSRSAAATSPNNESPTTVDDT